MRIKHLIKQYKWRLVFTLALILVESILIILFPLFIGKAISSVLEKEFIGIWQLGGLGIMLVIIGGLRRVFDSRFYAKMYTTISSRTIKQLPQGKYSLKTARLNMLSEMVKFAEFQLPEIIQHSLGLLGIVVIIAFINLKIFIACLIAGSVVFVIYLISSKRTFRYNVEYNDELEAQVNILASNRQLYLKHHLIKLMKWNIKLSDIETINFSLSWFVMMLLLGLSIVVSIIGEEGVKYGALIALIMYVYQYIESVVSLPIYFQQWLRLKEIKQRIQHF